MLPVRIPHTVMLRREHARLLVMVATSVSSTIQFVLQQAQRVARAKRNLVCLFLELARTTARLRGKDAAHLMCMGTTPVFVNVTTMTTVRVLALTPFYRPVVLVAAGLADGERGAPVASVVVAGHGHAPIAAMGKSRPKHVTLKPAVDGEHGMLVAQVVEGERRREQTVVMVLPKPNRVTHNPVVAASDHGQHVAPVAAGERALAQTRVRSAV